MENIIEVNQATKIIGDKIILDNINLSFETGKIHGIIGRNGAGKTMLMKSICGLMRLSSGNIQVGKINLNEKTDDIPEDIGIIIESPGFLPQFSGFKNLKFLAGIKDLISDDEILQALEIVGLTHAKDLKVANYSMGMRQRLGLAQAFMENQHILILDEPMNGLDNQGVQDMRKLLLELKDSGRTIILASHTQEDIKILCDTVVELDHGKVINKETFS
ncbi:ABC transporter ATP-binding protein [Fundicoccus culcitae]|uniref:ATP-binding cassette domain-containing protein n=1 Tax=Fundicoccus culcitae TaxID=2969821 RepID=A0ABY5P6W9_9LACT|nr:ATP-binding cassette domain-containing protein [Fundicoccus culcitae]UUX34345.1 ATP-binding cassette domain-containing protein [Fundicoccus culcitae]